MQLHAGLIDPLPPTLSVGPGNSLLITGWYEYPTETIHTLELSAGALRVPITHTFVYPYAEKPGDSMRGRGGFWCILRVPQGTIGTFEVMLHATLASGRELSTALGSIACIETTIRPMEDPDRRPLAICMATYHPDLTLFERQIRSIQGQTFQDWLCIVQDDCSEPALFEAMKQIIGDDPRFYIFRNEQNLGFYHNFERSLGHVPETAHFVALSDQDDEWYPTKLEQSLKAFTEETTLVFCDMRILRPDGSVISETFWRKKANNYTDFSALLLANSITGAASVFRRSLLAKVLPFPPVLPFAYHDWWIACVAMLEGRTGYVDTPLYNYIQHERNVQGFEPDIRHAGKRRVRSVIWRERGKYFRTLLCHALTASVLRQRCRGLPCKVDHLLERVASGSFGLLWLHALRGTLLGKHTEQGSRRIPLSIAAVKFCNLVFSLKKSGFSPPTTQRHVRYMPTAANSSSTSS